MQCEEKYGIVEIIETEGMLYTADTAVSGVIWRFFQSGRGICMQYTKKDLKEQLYQMGLDGTETILIHSSMKLSVM